MESGLYGKFPFYTGMNDAHKLLLHDGAVKKQLAKGQILMGDNDHCNGIPLVIKGRLRLFRISSKGREMTLYKINEGELCILAAVCAMGNIKYDFSLEAEEDSLLANLSADVFKDLLQKSEPFKTYVFNTLAEKLLQAIDTIEMVAFVSIEERILEYLAENSNDLGEVKTTHEKMAIDLGSSREVISRQLKKMAEKNMLTINRGKIILNISCKK
ncbi:MAG: Crp/Fnr family transcriptional regulator [Eubacteriales bacterium]|nr:Crp/Fnr family transcriptional regulator [Eubacteriales bacterium]